MADQTPAPPYPDDPDAPYFEALYSVAQRLRPGITRAEALAEIRAADPTDTLRIREPWSPEPDPAELSGPAPDRSRTGCDLASECGYPVCWSARPGHQPPTAGCDHWHGDGLPTAPRED